MPSFPSQLRIATPRERLPDWIGNSKVESVESLEKSALQPEGPSEDTGRSARLSTARTRLTHPADLLYAEAFSGPLLVSERSFLVHASPSAATEQLHLSHLALRNRIGRRARPDIAADGRPAKTFRASEGSKSGPFRTLRQPASGR